MWMSWKTMSSTAPSEALFRHDDLPLPIEIRGVRGARRMRLRLDEKRGVLKLTGPLRMNRKAALQWAAEQRAPARCSHQSHAGMQQTPLCRFQNANNVSLLITLVLPGSLKQRRGTDAITAFSLSRVERRVSRKQ